MNKNDIRLLSCNNLFTTYYTLKKIISLVKWYHITSRVSFLFTALSHWYPHIICNKLKYHANYVLGPVSWKSRNFSFLFMSSKYRGSKPSIFVTLLLFLTLKTCQKISFSKQTDRNLTTGFSGPKSSKGLLRKRPRASIIAMPPSASLLTKGKVKKFCLPMNTCQPRKRILKALHVKGWWRWKIATQNN